MKSLLKPWRHCRCSSLTPTHIRCYGIVPNSYLALCDCPRYYHPSDCNGNFSKLAIWQSIPLCALALDKSFRSKKSIPVFSTWTSLGYCENLPWRSWYWDSKVKFHHNSTEAMILPQILRSTSSCSPLWRAPLWASRGTSPWRAASRTLFHFQSLKVASQLTSNFVGLLSGICAWGTELGTEWCSDFEKKRYVVIHNENHVRQLNKSSLRCSLIPGKYFHTIHSISNFSRMLFNLIILYSFLIRSPLGQLPSYTFSPFTQWVPT